MLTVAIDSFKRLHRTIQCRLCLTIRSATHRHLALSPRRRGALRRRSQARSRSSSRRSDASSSGCRCAPRSKSAWAPRARRSISSRAPTGIVGDAAASASARRDESAGLDRADDDLRRLARARAEVGGSRRIRLEKGFAQLRTRACPSARRWPGHPHRAAACLPRRSSTQLPNLPIEEEGRLNDPALRENFVERVFAYQRLRALFARPLDDQCTGRLSQHAQAAAAVAFASGLRRSWADWWPEPSSIRSAT